MSERTVCDLRHLRRVRRVRQTVFKKLGHISS